MNEYYWVLFVRSKTFWEKFFYGDFNHVAVLKNDGYNWIFIDPRPHELHLEILPYASEEDEEEIFKYFIKDFKAIKVFVRNIGLKDTDKSLCKKFIKSITPKLYTCVKVTKYILGIKVKGIFPVSFYQHLNRVYKEEIIDHELIVDSMKEYRSE